MGHRTARGRTRIVVMIAAAAVAGCAAELPRSASERSADEELAARVELALDSDPAVYARHVDVDVRRGVVRLSGFVFSTEDLYEARRAAAGVPGVTGVVEQLELMVGGRSGSR